MSLMQRNTIIVLLALFLLYFATGPGWYRLLLPTHVLLIPFVTHGIIHITGKKVSIYILIFFIVMQTWWQWSYRGSSRSTAAVETANIIQEQYAEKALIIRQAEIFVQLPEKDHWLFLPHEKMSSRIPTRLTALSEEQKCMWQIQKLGEAQRAEYDSAILLSGSYTLFKPTSCND
jgi:hypothetical protein